jgi:hypothetical protein
VAPGRVAVEHAKHFAAPALGAYDFLAQGVQALWAGLDWKEPAAQRVGEVTATPGHLEPTGHAVHTLDPSLFA